MDNTEDVGVYVAVMAHGGFVTSTLAKRMTEWMQHRPFRMQFCFFEGEVPVCSARNKAVKHFLSTSMTHILFWDHDVMPPRGGLEHLVADDKHIVSGVYHGQKINEQNIGHIAPIVFKQNGDGIRAPYQGEGLEEVYAVGAGFLLVRRGVLEDTHPAFKFEADRDGITDVGEDFHFCMKSHSAGYGVWCDFDVVCDHYRTARFAPMALRLDLERRGGVEITYEDKKHGKRSNI